MSSHQDLSNPSAPSAAAALLDLIVGSWVSRALYVVAKLGIADLLREHPKSSVELAEATGMYAPALYRVLRTLASVGVVREDDAGQFE